MKSIIQRETCYLYYFIYFTIDVTYLMVVCTDSEHCPQQTILPTVPIVTR